MADWSGSRSSAYLDTGPPVADKSDGKYQNVENKAEATQVKAFNTRLCMKANVIVLSCILGAFITGGLYFVYYTKTKAPTVLEAVSESV